MKKDEGITLIALILTIILILIIAGVVLTLALGENGLINLSKEAAKEYKQAELNEQNDIDKLYSSIKIAENSQITLTMEELDKYIEKKMNEKSFTGTELLKEPAIVPTSTKWVTRNVDFSLENSIDNYEFLLFTFGNYNDSERRLNVKSSMLISVDKIKCGEKSEASYFNLASCDGSQYTSAGMIFKDYETICLYDSGASNSARQYFAIESVKGIKWNGGKIDGRK